MYNETMFFTFCVVLMLTSVATVFQWLIYLDKFKVKSDKVHAMIVATAVMGAILSGSLGSSVFKIVHGS